MSFGILLGIFLFSGTAEVSGLVDTLGADSMPFLVPGVDVSLVASDGGVEPLETVSGQHGEFCFSNVPPGNYLLKADMEGFQTFEKEIRVAGDVIVVENIRLKIAQVAARAEVSARGFQLSAKKSSVSGGLDGQQIQDVPLRSEQFTDTLPLIAFSPWKSGRTVLRGGFGLFYGRVPLNVTVSPVLDIHNGFPYSAVDEHLSFVGRRNRAGRFPRFVSLDFQVLKSVKIPGFGDKVSGRVGFKVFNVTGHFNPRDIQNNLGASEFGSFYNSIGRVFRGKFMVDF